jgi:ketosteroid isomerase-like protein
MVHATESDVIAANLAAVEAHFHSEATGEVEAAVDLYTDDAVWESPARGLRFEGKEATAANYRRMFDSLHNVEFQCVQRFATADRVVDDSIVTFDLVGDGMVNAPLPVGSSVEMRLVHIFEMRDGKISKELAYEIWRPKA